MTNEEIIESYFYDDDLDHSFIDAEDFSDIMDKARKDQQNKLEEYISLLKEYIKALGNELDDAVNIAAIHGWKSTRIKEGELMRDKIENFEKNNL